MINNHPFIHPSLFSMVNNKKSLRPSVTVS